MTSGKKVGDWTLAELITATMEKDVRAESRKAMTKEAHFLRKKILQGIRSGAPGGKKFAELAQSTLAVRRFKGRGGKKPLIVSGALRNSIRVKRSGNEVFVGVLRSAKNNRFNVGQIHEFGSRPIVVQLTPKARRFLMKIFRESGMINDPGSKSAGSTGKPSSGGGMSIAIVRIPARPFLGPIAEKFAKPRDVKARFEKNLATGLQGRLGTAT